MGRPSAAVLGLKSASPTDLKTNDRTFVVIGECQTARRHLRLSAGFDLRLPPRERRIECSDPFAKSVLYVEHVATGTDLFRLICDRDMEGIVAKQASAHYTPEATTCVKIKNRQTPARRLLFKGRDIASLAAIIEKIWRWTGLADDS